MKCPRCREPKMARAGGSRLDPMFHCGNCGCAILSRSRMRNHFYRRPEKHRLPRGPLSLVWRRESLGDGTGISRDKQAPDTGRIFANRPGGQSNSNIVISTAA